MAGAHYVVPPYLGEEFQWASSWGNPGGAGGIGASAGAGGSDDISQSQSAPTDPTLTWGRLDPNTLRVKIETAAPIGRYNELIPSVHADGHTSLDKPGALTDMRKWIDAATTGYFRHE